MSPPSSHVFAFDAYGTLLDVHAAVAQHAKAVGPDAVRLSELWRSKQLEYSWVTALMGRYEPFWTLTERALDHALSRVPTAPASMRKPLLDAYRHLNAYPEAPAVLKALRERGARACVLSNGNASMLAEAFASAQLTSLVDRLISVDDVKTFKTHPSVYALVTTAYGVAPQQVTMVSSNRWDVAGALAVGFNAMWINRAQLDDEYPALAPTRVCNDLRGVLDA